MVSRILECYVKIKNHNAKHFPTDSSTRFLNKKEYFIREHTCLFPGPSYIIEPLQYSGGRDLYIKIHKFINAINLEKKNHFLHKWIQKSTENGKTSQNPPEKACCNGGRCICCACRVQGVPNGHYYTSGCAVDTPGCYGPPAVAY